MHFSYSNGYYITMKNIHVLYCKCTYMHASEHSVESIAVDRILETDLEVDYPWLC